MTGHITRYNTSGNIRAGTVLGSVKKGSGYIQLKFDNVEIYNHQLAFFYMTGRWTALVDHRDGNKQNNVWTNLREATVSTNQVNKPKTRVNKSGYTGVRLKAGKYVAEIKHQGTGYYLGVYTTPEEAYLIYCAASIELFGEYAYCMR